MNRQYKVTVFLIIFIFLGATKHLYNWLCPLVGRSVGNAFVRRSTRRTLLAYLALLYVTEASTWAWSESATVVKNLQTLK